ncbi:class D sortase [Oscillibacter sp.]|jgi:LPXTG-site transpeptidase (sortase) family protein|uniref:class D sortase n=1 Tax=Oscillibacter sp. TaxID=1945593 RepID=UPI00289CE98D|nr:class D sortase [Oscillibacter sp.]
MKKLTMLLLALSMAASLAVPASAVGPMEYTFDGTGDPEYGKPTSIEVIYTADGGAQRNEDVSKNAALAPPSFGSPSADTLNTGTPLTPNLAPGYQPTAGAVINGSTAAVQPPAMGGGAASGTGALYVPGSSTVTVTNPGSTSSGYTEVTDDLYYRGGHLGTLEIPAIDLEVKIYQGTDSRTLAKGVGHFTETSIWAGNVGLAAHNRGTNSYFGQIHTLEAGDRITLTTKLGTRTYEVTSVAKVSETDRSSLADTRDNCLTLYTCVRNERDLRWCVRAVEIS